MKDDDPVHLSLSKAKALRSAGKLPDDALIALTSEDFGLMWLSPEPQPFPLPLEVGAALESSLEAIRMLLADSRADPISFFARGMTADRLAKSPSVLAQLCNQHGAGERFDALKKSKEPFVTLRRRTLVWNQFLIDMKEPPHFPGFSWFSDENTAGFLSEFLGKDVSTVDVENDRRHFQIKKLPAKYLFPPRKIRLAIAACRRLKKEGRKFYP